MEAVVTIFRCTVVAPPPDGTDAGSKTHRESAGRLELTQVNVRLLENDSEIGSTSKE